MKKIIINHPEGEIKVTKKYSNCAENYGTIVELGNFNPGVLNFMKTGYIRSSDPVDVELAISENHAQNTVEETTTYFLKKLFQGAEIDIHGKDVLTNFGINGVIGYSYTTNCVYVNAYNLGLMNEPNSKLFKVAFAFLPVFNIAWQLKQAKNIELRFIEKSWLEYHHEESIVNSNIGGMKLVNKILYVIVPDEENEIISLIQDKDFLQKFYDTVDDFCQKF